MIPGSRFRYPSSSFGPPDASHQSVTGQPGSRHVERDPHSIAWKINSEIVLLLGWSPAILLQVAHPLVAAGVAQHSLFLTDPHGRLARLRRTLDVMLDLTFGTAAQVDRAAAAINRVHDRVNGQLGAPAGPFSAGTRYSAHDPELLRWVHCTVLDVFPRTYELYVGPLTEQEKDRYCAEASMVAPLLGLPENYLPASQPALRRYMREMLSSGILTPSAESRALAHDIYHPYMPRVAAPLVFLVRLPMVGLLPPSIRAAYGFPWDVRREHLFHDTARLARPLLALTPGILRHWPAARRAYERARRGEWPGFPGPEMDGGTLGGSRAGRGYAGADGAHTLPHRPASTGGG
ncbi:MAG: DUF2236 domain-containing protein [Chloroflexi bacterium]|nr:DUF2236 domain-containing protein [Chloroflexota bacterium]